MNITLFTRPKSVLTVGLALLLAFDPNLIFQWTGLVLGDAGTLLGRILGLVYLGIAIELWFVRSNSDLPARNALLLTAVDCSVVALLVQVQLAGLMNVLGWGLIAVYLGSGLGFLWCACKSPGMAPYAKAFPDPSDLHFFDITGFQPLRTFCPARRHRRTGQTHPQHNKNLL